MKKSIRTAIISSLVLGTVGFSLAQTTTPSTTPKKTLDVACVQAAIEKRDSSLSTGVSALNSSVISALSVRKDALKAAVALPTKTEIQSARKTANATFDKSVKAAQTLMKQTREKAWSTYKTEAKGCGQKETEVPTVRESTI